MFVAKRWEGKPENWTQFIHVVQNPITLYTMLST